MLTTTDRNLLKLDDNFDIPYLGHLHGTAAHQDVTEPKMIIKKSVKMKGHTNLEKMLDGGHIKFFRLF